MHSLFHRGEVHFIGTRYTGLTGGEIQPGSRQRSQPEYPANLFQPVPRDGNSAVHWRVEPKVVVSGVARGERPYPIQIDHVFPMAAHERRARELAGKLIQPMYGMVGFFSFGPDQRVAPLGFEIKNPVRLDQINRPVRAFHRQSVHDSRHRPHVSSSVLRPVHIERFILGMGPLSKIEIWCLGRSRPLLKTG